MKEDKPRASLQEEELAPSVTTGHQESSKNDFSKENS